MRKKLLAGALLFVAVVLSAARADASPWRPAAPPSAAPALRGASRATIARGTRSCSRAGLCTVTVRLTRRGRSLLRRARHPRVTLALAFKPRSGADVARRTAIRLG